MMQIREVVLLNFVTIIFGKNPVFKLKPRTAGMHNQRCFTTDVHKDNHITKFPLFIF